MNYFLWFVKLRFSFLKNSLFKDSNTIKKTLSIALVMVVGQIALTRILYKTVFSNIFIMDEMVNGLLIVFFFVAVTWIYLISFAQSINAFIQNFYKSPDMNYLITIPIPFNHVFLFRFLEHNFNSTKGMLFLFFPFLSALGLWANAPFTYFLLIIPYYFLISIIPSVLGVIISMISLRFVPAKVFNTIIPVFTFAINVSFALMFTRAQSISTTYIIRIIEFFEKPWVSNMIPPISGIKLFYSSIVTEWSLLTFLLLLLITFVLVVFAFIISKKWYFEGWMRNQHVIEEVAKKKKVRSNRGSSFKSKSIIVWIETEWKMAIRNHEMLMGSIFMFLFFIFAVFTLTYSNLFSENPIIGVSMLIMIASITNIMAISILFIPAEIKNDKNLWKKRYWLLKIMPVNERKIFNIQCNMFFIPAFIISFLGIIVYSLVSGLSIGIMILSTISLFLVLYSSSAVYVCGELVSLTDFFEQYAFFGNLATFLIPLIYGVFSSGIVTLYLAKDFLSQVAFLSSINGLLSLPITIVISVFTVIFTFVVSKLVFEKVWRELQI